MVIAAAVDSGSNVPFLCPNEQLFKRKHESKLNISDANGGTSSPSFDGGVDIIFSVYSKTNFSRKGEIFRKFAPQKAQAPTPPKSSSTKQIINYEDIKSVPSLTCRS